ncbi:ATP-binding cassette domain-containing protein [Amycolatopsis cynarae]|uniref:ATP-binding cassette domain-containing protein n=1 Tax=Amycolatopsis cynarae TaxID=2995223 RepID=A0ABY7AWE4_9PSEU|nr:ATP-binding cassette domain-containing protein [Amycolatopsis sp. HUAS 11-8]WAL62948.1 ATP-binding cassette domain-containing protein [Amycolatopsis sp. HUAS 11-8]
MTAAIEVQGLVKHFGDVRAVNGVDLEVPAGTVLGLLGPNGAGKTTMIRMLATLVPPDAGRAWVAGHEISERPDLVRESMGLTGQYSMVDIDISGRENLYLFARLLDLPRRAAWARVDELLERLELTRVAGRLVSTYSGGLRRRLDLAASLLGRPKVLYLDEPTTGLDPHSRNGLWDIARELVAQGTTVLLTTQYMTEAEELADHVAVMDDGAVVANGPIAELCAKVGGTVLRVRPAPSVPPNAVASAFTDAGLGMVRTDEKTGLVSLTISHDDQLTRAVRTLGETGLPLVSVDTHTPGLDEVFLALTGRTPNTETRRKAGEESDGTFADRPAHHDPGQVDD